VLGEDSGDLEHLSSSFAVTGSDERSVDVLESSLLEELVSSVGQVVADSSHSSDQLGSRTHVGFLSQVFQRVVLTSKGEGVRIAFTVNSGGVNFRRADL